MAGFSSVDVSCVMSSPLASERNWVGKEIGPIAKPKDIRFGDNLPKTRSGKIMRRLLRSVAKGESVTQLLRNGLGLVAGRARPLQHDEGADGLAGGVVRAGRFT